MIDGMFQQGTDATLNDQVARPAAPKPVEAPAFGTDLFTAPFRGVGGGVAKSMAFGAEVSGAFGQVVGAAGTDSAGGMFSVQSQQERQQSERARSVVLKNGPEMSNAVGDVLRQRAKDILPDPATASTSAQVVSGLADMATRAVGYTVTLGPAGPLAFGGDTALEESDRLKQLGVDKGTRTKAGAVAGVLNAGAVVIPMAGPTAATRFIAGTAVGEGTIIGQAVAEKSILKAAGYDKVADSFDPLDPVALALGVVPGALGAKFGGKPRAIKTEADMRVAAALTPEEQARSNAYERSPANLASLEKAIAAEKRPDVKATLQGELDKQRAAAGHDGVAAAVKSDPDFAPAARVNQAVDAVDVARLTPDTDLVGRDAHMSAVELAGDQMARGEHVDVEYIVAPTMEPPPIQVAEHNGWLSATVDGGLVGGHIRDGALHISSSELAPELRGTGVGTAMYRALIDEAHGRGLRVFSDSTVSSDAVRVYDSLGRRGYDVQRTPGGGEMMSPSGVSEGAFGAGAVSPAFEVRAKQRGPERTAAAFDELRAAHEPVEARAKAEPVKAAREAPAEAPASPKAPRAGEGEGKAPSSVERAAEDVHAFDPDMLVQLEGMDAPMTVGELLARVKEEAANDVRDGRLLEVAAACDLRA